MSLVAHIYVNLLFFFLSLFFISKSFIVGGFGGFHALAVLFFIKFKIFIIASIIAFSVYYYTKLAAAKKCAGEYIREGSTYQNAPST